MEMTIKQLQEQVENLLIEKGFLNKFLSVRKCLTQEMSESIADEVMGYYLGALLATEPAEYIDAVKKGKGVEAELEEAADTILRALNIFIVNGADAETVIRAKMEKNMGRPFMYGHGEGK